MSRYPSVIGWAPGRSIALVVASCALVSSCAIVNPDSFSFDDSSSSTPATDTTVRVREVDGGPQFYGMFRDSFPTDPSFFPVAVWSESVVDDTGWPVDKGVGLNTYLQPADGSEFDRIELAGMHVVTSTPRGSTTTEGYFTADEADMWAGPGDAQWSGKMPGEGDVCVPAGSECGYSVMKTAAAAAPPEVLRISNYGKGIVFWQSDAEARRFVNDYQDVVSADVYWFTDVNVCGASEGGALVGDGTELAPDQCRLAANYGRTVDRVRSLVDPPASKPVWSFVEVGHPAQEDDAPSITVPEIRAAVWSSLIAGARGITYFVHNFGGPCETQHAIRDCGEELQSGITAVNEQIRDLAPVLNAPFVDGLVSGDGSVDVSTKVHDGDLYVLAGAAVARPSSPEITIGCDVDSAEVVGEDRTVSIDDGRLVDDFADGNAVHIYRLGGAAACLEG